MKTPYQGIRRMDNAAPSPIWCHRPPGVLRLPPSMPFTSPLCLDIRILFFPYFNIIHLFRQFVNHFFNKTDLWEKP